VPLSRSESCGEETGSCLPPGIELWCPTIFPTRSTVKAMSETTGSRQINKSSMEKVINKYMDEWIKINK
jgi:hypothetical protein